MIVRRRKKVKVFYCNTMSFDYTLKVSWTYIKNKLFIVYNDISFVFLSKRNVIFRKLRIWNVTLNVSKKPLLLKNLLWKSRRQGYQREPRKVALSSIKIHFPVISSKLENFQQITQRGTPVSFLLCSAWGALILHVGEPSILKL